MRRLLVPAAALSILTAACVWQGSDETTASTTVPSTTEAPPPTLAPEDATAVGTTALDFLTAWAAADLDAVRVTTTGFPDDLDLQHTAWREGLSIESAAYTIVSTAALGDQAEATYRADLRLAGAGGWSYEGTIGLIPAGDGWTIPWTATLIHPSMEDLDTLVLERVWPTRAPILGTMGITLVTERAVKVIGVIPEQIADLELLLLDLETLADIPPSVVTRELERPAVRPDWWLPVGWLSVIDYLPVQTRIEGIEGIEVREDTARLAPAAPFAEHILGTTGPITADLLEQFGEPYRPGDIVGLSGLELAMESTLAGYPSFEVRRVNQFGRITEVLHTVTGVPSTATRTSLAVDTQLAAEAAIDAVELPAAIVAIDAATGEVRAIASRPLDGFNRALAGLYPPGSTFKVVTATALLGGGISAEDTVACPGTVTIGGREFRNAGERDLGEISFATAFAESCNTTFAGLAAETLGLDGLGETAASFGFNVFYQVGLPTPGASFAEPPEVADVAAAAIGHGGTQVTPLHQETVAAAVANGAWRRPVLVEGSQSDPIPLDPEVVAQLTSLMELVVLEGTGTNAAVEGQNVYGKTGSAEFAEGQPTHSWFIGFWEGLGIAVVVEGGGAGGEAAAPILAAFVGDLSD